MAYFMTRVILKDAPEQAYTQLNAAMEARKFYRSLTNDAGVEHALPVGDYFSLGALAVADVHQLASGAIASIGRAGGILVTECVNFVWTGLEPAQ